MSGLGVEELRTVEQALAERVFQARRRLLESLPETHRVTRPVYGSEEAATIEDHAKDLPECAEALREYQMVLAEALEVVIGGEVVKRAPDTLARVVQAWRVTREYSGTLSHSELLSTAQVAARHALSRLRPGRGASFYTYLRLPVFRALDEARARSEVVAVEVPRAVARAPFAERVERFGSHSVEAMADAERVSADGDEVSPHSAMIVSAETMHAATTEEEDPYWRDFFGYPELAED